MSQRIFVLRLQLEGGPKLVPATADPVGWIVPDLVETDGQTSRFDDATVKVIPVPVQGYFAHQIGCSEVLQCITQAFTSLGKCSVGGFHTGPLTITLVVEDPVTQETILALHREGVLIKRVNQAVQEYGSKFNDPQPEFTALKFLRHQTSMISDGDLQKVKNENGLLSSFIIEEGRRNPLLEPNWRIIQIYKRSPKKVDVLARLSKANDQTQRACAQYFPAKFSFEGQKFTYEAVKGVACILRHVERMEELNLNEKFLPPGSIQLIVNAIKEGQVEMKKLNLSRNTITNDEAKSLSSIVEYVEELHLRGCELSSESIAIICNAISEKECMIKKLGLSGNPISNDEAKSLSSIVEYVDELDLGYCRFSSRSIAIICNAISEKKCKIKMLNLSGNHIFNDEAKSLSNIVEYVEELDLGGCSLGSVSIAIICNAISEKKCKVTWLGLHGNFVSNDGAKSLASIIEYIEELNLTDSILSRESIAIICNAISEKKHKMKKLSFAGNFISNDEAKSVSSIVEFVEELDLGLCSLRREAIAIICNAISEKKCKMKWLDLSENLISNDGAKSLSSIVEYVEVLCLGQHDITEEGVEVIRSKLRNLGLRMDRIHFI